MSDTPTRTESDLLGTREVPAEAYYGVHTLRAAENFTISNSYVSEQPALINALAAVKEAAATANRDIGELDATRANAIIQAAQDVRHGQLHDQFIIDLIQGGAGTSTNMNINEVVANRGLEILGYSLGDYDHLHPLNDVNMAQSTNDVYPSALKIALFNMLDDLLNSLQVLRTSLSTKAEEFAHVIKMGRTQLQDAVPMTQGQEFIAFANMLGADAKALESGREELCQLNLGGTAIGTELNAHPEYRARAIAALREITGIERLVSAENLVESTQDTGVYVELSGILKRVATKLSKISNDLRLMSSGPRAGLNELKLPARQAGSSIMPGKVNPVIPEAVNQVAFDVIGNDLTVTMASEAGQLQLNAFEPIIARALFDSIQHLSAACVMLAEKCVDDIVANKELSRTRVEESAGLATIFSPVIGYKEATSLAVDANETGAKVTDMVVERGLLTREQVTQMINKALTLDEAKHD